MDENEYTSLKVLVDLDGPLLDVSLRYYRVYAKIIRELACSPLPPEVYWRLKRARAPIQDILARTGAGEQVAEYVEQRLSLVELPVYLRFDRLVPGARSVLRRLAQLEEVHVVTSRRNWESLMEELDRFDLHQYFTSVIAGKNRSGKWEIKKDLVIEANVLEKGCCGIVIGDTEGDVLLGKSLGVFTCAVLNGIRSRWLIEEMQPDYIIEDIRGLPDVVRELHRRNNEREQEPSP